MTQVIEYIVFPGALGLDITGPLEVFNTATGIAERRGEKNSGYQARFVSANQGQVRLSSGLQIIADTSFQDRLPADMLLIPGGNDIEGVINNQGYMDYIRQRSQEVKRVISVCKGALILAAAGILNDKEAVTHWRAMEQLKKEFPQVKVKADAIFTCDGNIYTSAGATAGIDLALSIVEEDLGVSIAVHTSKLLVLYFRRPGCQSQFSIPLKIQEAAGKSFSRLHEWLVKNMEKEITVEQMAEYTVMSERNFARVFKKETGMTPYLYLEILRLERARAIMLVGDLSLEKIAEICGFGGEERLRRAFLRHYGITPSQYRLHYLKL